MTKEVGKSARKKIIVENIALYVFIVTSSERKKEKYITIS